MRSFTGPVLIVWATQDRLMPREHGPRLAALFPDTRLVEIDDSYTPIPEDQPERLTRAIRKFLTEGQPQGRAVTNSQITNTQS